MEKKSKEVKMGGAKQEDQKIPYEQLEQVALQLRAANNDLYKRLQSAQQAIAEFNEIGMLLDILGKSEYFCCINFESHVLAVTLGITKGCFFSNSRDCTGLEHVVTTEKLFGVTVCR